MSATTSQRCIPARSNLPVKFLGNLLTVSAMGASHQSLQLQKELGHLRGYYEFPASSIRDRRRERFQRLAEQWRRDTQWLSSTSEVAMHPAYQAMIGMGDYALPLIMDELRNNSGHWYWALKAISGEDPVPPRDRGVIKKMKSAWLKWGVQKGLTIE